MCSEVFAWVVLLVGIALILGGVFGAGRAYERRER